MVELRPDLAPHGVRKEIEICGLRCLASEFGGGAVFWINSDIGLYTCLGGTYQPRIGTVVGGALFNAH